MRRALVLCALVLAGCGETERAATAPVATPDPALTTPGSGTPPAPVVPVRKPVPADVRAELDGGAVGVLDTSGVTSVRPGSIDVTKDITVQDLDWSRWSAEGARGTGTVRRLVCDPNCGQGTLESGRATVVLAGVATCAGQRYFRRAELFLDGASRAAATYVRAPC